MKSSHLDEKGNAVMVDISGKDKTRREAVAMGSIKVSPKVMGAITAGGTTKGDVLSVAQIAGLMGVKKTSDIIPLCHNIGLSNASIVFRLHEETGMIESICTVGANERTGVEMEALTGVSVSLLTIYDMCKSIDKGMEITGIHLVSKSGGKSGDYGR